MSMFSRFLYNLLDFGTEVLRRDRRLAKGSMFSQRIDVQVANGLMFSLVPRPFFFLYFSYYIKRTRNKAN